MTTKTFQIENFYMLPAVVYSHRCTRCDALGREQATPRNGTGMTKIIAADGQGNYLCRDCVNELAVIDLINLMERIPAVLVPATWEAPAHHEVPAEFCDKCGQPTAVWTSEPKLKQDGFKLCQACRDQSNRGLEMADLVMR